MKLLDPEPIEGGEEYLSAAPIHVSPVAYDDPIEVPVAEREQQDSGTARSRVYPDQAGTHSGVKWNAPVTTRLPLRRVHARVGILLKRLLGNLVHESST